MAGLKAEFERGKQRKARLPSRNHRAALLLLWFAITAFQTCWQMAKIRALLSPGNPNSHMEASVKRPPEAFRQVESRHGSA